MKTNKIKLETLLKFCGMSNIDLVITTKKKKMKINHLL